MGFPQLNPICASSGIDCSCSEVYPNAFATRSESGSHRRYDHRSAGNAWRRWSRTGSIGTFARFLAVGFVHRIDECRIAVWGILITAWAHLDDNALIVARLRRSRLAAKQLDAIFPRY